MTTTSIGTKTSQSKQIRNLKNLPNGYRISQYYARYQRSQDLLAGSLLINIIMSIVYCEFTMKENDLSYWFLHYGYYFSYICSTFITYQVFILIVNRKTYYDYQSHYERLSIQNFVVNLVFKIGLLLIRPYPCFEGMEITFELEPSVSSYSQTHAVNSILTVIGLGQSFLVFGFLFNTSHLKSDRSNRICKLYGCKASNLYVVRGWFKRNYLLKLLAIFLAWSLICTSCFRIIEYRYNPQIQYLDNAFWLTFSTMFCIGYGDLVTRTNVGKWMGLIAMYTGVIFTYFSITLVNNFFKLDSKQKKTLNFLISLESKQQLKTVAQLYLRQTLWRVWKNHRNKHFGYYLPETIKQIQLRRRMREIRIKTRNNAHGSTFYNQCLMNFQKAMGVISNLNENNDRMLDYVDLNWVK